MRNDHDAGQIDEAKASAAAKSIEEKVLKIGTFQDLANAVAAAAATYHPNVGRKCGANERESGEKRADDNDASGVVAIEAAAGQRAKQQTKADESRTGKCRVRF